MAGELRKGIEGKFDEPGAVEKLGKGVANAGKEAGHALGRVGGTLLTGLKYAGLGITIPLWGPAKLAGSIWDDWAPENQILAAVIFLGYYGGAIVGGGIANEKYHEAKTKKELAAVIEQAPENMHVGHISEDGKNYQTFNMKELLNDERTYRTIPITQPIENVLGTRQGRVLYVGTTKVEADEKLMDKIKDRTFSQIYSMDLTTGEVVAMIDYSQKGTREETNGQLFQETRMIENGENAPTFLVKMQEKWYQAREGGFVPQGAVEIPPQKNYAQIPGSDFVFNQDGFDENILQVEHEGQTFGDIELTRGKNPIVFMMAQDVLKTE